jgi:hypothetical protein
MTTDQLERLLSPYSTFRVQSPREFRAAITGRRLRHGSTGHALSARIAAQQASPGEAAEHRLNNR